MPTDTERLDWIEKMVGRTILDIDVLKLIPMISYGNVVDAEWKTMKAQTFREAIDKAMSDE